MKLRVEKQVYGGAGLSRVVAGPLAGKTIFIPMTLPGELVEAHMAEERSSFANAELDLILEAAATRSEPGCPYYGACGGCHYQHATYAQQLEMKSAILRETLERVGLTNKAIPEIQTLAADPWAYRNRIRLQVRPASGSQPPALCYRRRGSHDLLAVNDCPIAAPVLVRALQAVERVLNSQATGPRYDTLFEEIEFFTNPEQGEILLALSTSRHHNNEADTQLQSLCNALATKIPELRGAALFPIHSESPGDAAKLQRPARTQLSWGEQSLTYRTAGFDYRVSTGSFFQINRHLLDPLVELVTRNQAGTLAWDLYAGAGLFARALASKFGMVRAVESAPTSCADLRHNLEGTTHKIVESSTVEFLRLHTANPASRKSASHPDLVVVDPPRAGLGSEVTTLIARIAPREIVYVSCDPATLARDLRALIQSGYQLQHLTMVDLFPQTFHMESVSRLSLR